MQGFGTARLSDVVIYHPSLRQYTGSALAAMLMSQLDYWFARCPGGFFKFLEPSPKNDRYRQGDSWVEELALTVEELRTAFKNLCTRYKSKSIFDKQAARGDIFGGRFYASYHDRKSGLTHYFRNHELVDRVTHEISESPPRFMGKSARLNISNSVNGEFQVAEASEEEKLEIEGEVSDRVEGKVNPVAVDLQVTVNGESQVMYLADPGLPIYRYRDHAPDYFSEDQIRRSSIKDPELVTDPNSGSLMLGDRPKTGESQLAKKDRADFEPTHTPVESISGELQCHQAAEPIQGLESLAKNPIEPIAQCNDQSCNIDRTGLKVREETTPLPPSEILSEQDLQVASESLEVVTPGSIVQTHQENSGDSSVVKKQQVETFDDGSVQLPLIHVVTPEKQRKERKASNKPGTLSDAFYEECLAAFNEHRTDRVKECPEFFGVRAKAAIKHFVFEEAGGNKELALKCFKSAMTSISRDPWLNQKVESSNPVTVDSYFSITGKIYGLYTDAINRDRIEAEIQKKKTEEQTARSRHYAQTSCRSYRVAFDNDALPPELNKRLGGRKVTMGEWWQAIDRFGLDLELGLRIEFEESTKRNKWGEAYEDNDPWVYEGDRKMHYLEATQRFNAKVLVSESARLDREPSAIDYRSDAEARAAIVAQLQQQFQNCKTEVRLAS